MSRSRQPFRGLRVLTAGSARLSGTIPEALGPALSSLRSLQADDNAVTGKIPDSLQSLRACLSISLHRNRLSDTIPDALTFMTALSDLKFSQNHLRGQLRGFITSLPRLTMLYLSINTFTGYIPAGISALTILQMMEASTNHFEGSLPERSEKLQAVRMLSFAKNRLSGRIPDGIRYDTWLLSLQLESNDLGGRIPRAFQHTSSLAQLTIQGNGLSGAIPESLSFASSLSQFEADHNALAASLPRGLGLLQALTFLHLSFNVLTGSVPEILANAKYLKVLRLRGNQFTGYLHAGIVTSGLKHLDVCDNNLQGAIPAVLSSGLLSLKLGENLLRGSVGSACTLRELGILSVHMNDLSGAIPDCLASMCNLGKLELGSNRLRGVLPTAFSSLSFALLDVSDNSLTRSLPDIVAVVLLAHDNSFTGALPDSLGGPVQPGSASGRPVECRALSLSRNLLEGVVPRTVASNNLVVLGLGAKVGRPAYQQGTLPASLRRADSLQFVMAFHQSFAGNVPHLSSTLQVLSLQENSFKTMPDKVHFANGAVILVQNNRFSCHLPRSNCTHVNISLVAAGNHWRHPCKAFPEWVSSFERHGPFWTYETEGITWMARICASIAFLANVVACITKMSDGVIATIIKWRGAGGLAGTFAKVSFNLASCLATQTLVSILFLSVLLDWSRYSCPRTPALLSACLHEGSLSMVIVIFSWGSLKAHMSLLSQRPRKHLAAREALTPGASRSGQRQSILSVAARQQCLAWVFWVPLVLSLSSLALIDMAGKCVPDFLHFKSIWLKAISLSIGAFQGVMGSVVLPRLAGCITPRKHAFLSVAYVLSSFFFPVVFTLYLDNACWGRWSSWWDRCSASRRRQFSIELNCVPQEEPVCKLFEPGAPRFRVMHHNDICDPSMGKSVSSCVMSTYLRLQDLWLSKFLVAGVLLPAAQLGAGVRIANLDDEAVKLALFLEFAVLCVGPLPLLAPLLCLAVLTEIVVIAISWMEQNAMLGHEVIGTASASVHIVAPMSSGLHLAFASQSQWASVMCFLIIAGPTVYQACSCKCTCCHKRRRRRRRWLP